MTLTAMRPESGLSNGRDVSLCSVDQASASISALSVVFSDLYGSACSQEVGVADKEGLFVVVGVDKPAGDPIRPVAAYFARIGVEHIHAVDPDLNLGRRPR